MQMAHTEPRTANHWTHHRHLEGKDSSTHHHSYRDRQHTKHPLGLNVRSGKGPKEVLLAGEHALLQSPTVPNDLFLDENGNKTPGPESRPKTPLSRNIELTPAPEFALDFGNSGVPVSRTKSTPNTTDGVFKTIDIHGALPPLPHIPKEYTDIGANHVSTISLTPPNASKFSFPRPGSDEYNEADELALTGETLSEEGSNANGKPASPQPRSSEKVSKSRNMSFKEYTRTKPTDLAQQPKQYTPYAKRNYSLPANLSTPMPRMELQNYEFSCIERLERKWADVKTESTRMLSSAIYKYYFNHGGWGEFEQVFPNKVLAVWEEFHSKLSPAELSLVNVVLVSQNPFSTGCTGQEKHMPLLARTITLSQAIRTLVYSEDMKTRESFSSQSSTGPEIEADFAEWLITNFNTMKSGNFSQIESLAANNTDKDDESGSSKNKSRKNSSNSNSTSKHKSQMSLLDDPFGSSSPSSSYGKKDKKSKKKHRSSHGGVLRAATEKRLSRRFVAPSAVSISDLAKQMDTTASVTNRSVSEQVKPSARRPSFNQQQSILHPDEEAPPVPEIPDIKPMPMPKQSIDEDAKVPQLTKSPTPDLQPLSGTNLNLPPSPKEDVKKKEPTASRPPTRSTSKTARRHTHNFFSSRSTEFRLSTDSLNSMFRVPREFQMKDLPPLPTNANQQNGSDGSSKPSSRDTTSTNSDTPAAAAAAPQRKKSFGKIPGAISHFGSHLELGQRMAAVFDKPRSSSIATDGSEQRAKRRPSTAMSTIMDPRTTTKPTKGNQQSQQELRPATANPVMATRAYNWNPVPAEGNQAWGFKISSLVYHQPMATRRKSSMPAYVVHANMPTLNRRELPDPEKAANKVRERPKSRAKTISQHPPHQKPFTELKDGKPERIRPQAQLGLGIKPATAAPPKVSAPPKTPAPTPAGPPLPPGGPLNGVRGALYELAYLSTQKKKAWAKNEHVFGKMWKTGLEVNRIAEQDFYDFCVDELLKASSDAFQDLQSMGSKEMSKQLYESFNAKLTVLLTDDSGR